MPLWTNWQSRFSQKEEVSRFDSEKGYQLNGVNPGYWGSLSRSCAYCTKDMTWLVDASSTTPTNQSRCRLMVRTLKKGWTCQGYVQQSSYSMSRKKSGFESQQRRQVSWRILSMVENAFCWECLLQPILTGSNPVFATSICRIPSYYDLSVKSCHSVKRRPIRQSSWTKYDAS